MKGLAWFPVQLCVAVSLGAPGGIAAAQGSNAPPRVVTWSEVWVDSTRREFLTENPTDVRTVPVTIWLPRAPTRPAPIVVFSPGYPMAPGQYKVLLANLASHGYLVIGLGHAFDTRGAPTDSSMPLARPSDPGDTFEFTRQMVGIRVQDARFALTRALALAASTDNRLRGAADSTRAAIIGHSRGGLTAFEACARDSRFRACVNLDGGVLGGPMYPDMPHALRSPALWLQALHIAPGDSQLRGWSMTRAQWDSFDLRANRLLEKGEQGSWRVTLPDTAHLQFADPDARRFATEADRARAAVSLSAASEVLVAFLDSRLNQRPLDRLRQTVSRVRGTFAELAPAGVRRHDTNAISIIDSIAAEMYAAHGVGGVALGVIRGDSLVWSRGYGLADVAQRAPVSSTTVFRIGSITKQFTAVMFLQLVGARRIQFGDPVEALVPSARSIADWNSFRRTPSLYELATHMSGLAREPDHAERYASGPVSAWESRLDSALRETHLLNEPGTRYRYSNIGYALLGEALRRAAGEPYVDYVERRILAPLGMTHTAFVYRSALGKLARGNAVGATAVDTLVPANEHAGRGFRVPNGALYSTVEDMARFVAFELGHGPATVLPPAVLDTNFRRHVTANAAMTDAGGLGFVTVREGTVIFQGHAGDVAGYQAYAVFDRRSDVGIVALRNASGGRFDMHKLVVEGMRALTSQGSGPPPR
jgi:CubicO group peptidase (beta-lactamase class C family)/alpha-beta hydrolase superfamily lysophospholipase